MIAEDNITTLLSQWKERIAKDNYSDEYKCALGECIYDLQETFDKIKKEEDDNLQEVINNLPSQEAENYLRELAADEYLATIEVHDSSVA